MPARCGYIRSPERVAAAVGKETGPIPGHNETSPDARAASDDPRVPEDGCGSFGSERLDREAGAAFVVEHTESVSRLLAYTVCRGYLSRHFLIGPTAWCLRNFVEWRYLMAAFRTFEHLLGTEDFMRIIRSVERANPTKLRLSRARKGS